MGQQTNIVFNAIKGIFGALGDVMFPTIDDYTYKAKFTNPRELLRSRNTGFSVGVDQNLNDEMSFRHMIVTAPSGGGKSSKVCIPSLINLHGKGSVVINDCNKELYPKLGHLYSDTKTIIIDFSDKSCNQTFGWNPMPHDEADLPNFMTRISNLVHGKSHEQFWSIQSAEVLTSLGEVLYRFDEKYRTPSNLLHLLNYLMGKEAVFNKFMAKYATQKTWMEYLAFAKNSDNTKRSILSSAKATLAVFRQDHIQRITSHSSFDMNDIRHKPVAIFLQTSPADLDKYKLLISEFFNQLFAHLLSNLPKEKDLPVYMVIDEAGVVKIDLLSTAVVQLRKFKSGCLICCQSDEQLHQLYGKEHATTIISNCSRLIMTNAPLATAKEVSELSGKVEYEDEKGRTRVRELIAVDEVRSLEEDEGILFASNLRPIKLRMKPYYKDSRMREITSKEAPMLKSDLSNDPIPILNIEALSN